MIIAVAAVLIAVGYFSVLRLNQKMRDTKRMNDIVSVQRAMALLKKDAGTYLSACGLTPYSGSVSGCVGDNQNFKLNEYLSGLSEANDPSLSTDLCQPSCPIRPCNYNFTEISKDAYKIFFYLEAGVEDFGAGCYLLTETGVKAGN